MKPLAGLIFSCVFACSALSGCFWMASKPKTFQDDTDPRQNKLLYRDGVVLHLAIERFMARHEESAPESERWMASLLAPGYLPHEHFPANPWTASQDVWDESGRPQSNVIALADCPALGSAYADPTPVGTALGAGVMPSAGPTTCLTYGAFVYGATRGGLHYVLYGIGRRGDQAIVRFLATPEGNCCL